VTPSFIEFPPFFWLIPLFPMIAPWLVKVGLVFQPLFWIGNRGASATVLLCLPRFFCDVRGRISLNLARSPLRPYFYSSLAGEFSCPQSFFPIASGNTFFPTFPSRTAPRITQRVGALEFFSVFNPSLARPPTQSHSPLRRVSPSRRIISLLPVGAF